MELQAVLVSLCCYYTGSVLGQMNAGVLVSLCCYYTWGKTKARD